MIYKTLDTLPYKVFVKILETNDTKLLSTKKKHKANTHTLWERLLSEYYELSNDEGFNRQFAIQKKIQRLESEYLATSQCLDALEFEYNEHLVEVLKEFGYKIEQKSLTKDLALIRQEAKGLLMLIKKEKRKIIKEEVSNTKTNIDKVIISYNDGKMLNTNEVTVTQFLGIQELANERMKVLKEANNGI